MLLGLAGGCNAEAVARVDGCLPAGGPCQVRVGLKPGVSDVQTTSALFITVMAMSATGQPNPQIGGYYTPKDGWQMGTPMPAWVGVLSRKVATVPFPDGGVCGLVRQVKGPAGIYGMYVGWGSLPDQSSTDDDETMQLLRKELATTEDPQMRAKMEELSEQYSQAKSKAAGQSGVVALSNMVKAQTYWNVASFDCSAVASDITNQQGVTQ